MVGELVKMITWFYGNTGAGKTTAAKKLANEQNAILLDADQIRKCLSNFDLTEEGRRGFNSVMSNIAEVLSNQGFKVVVATICPYRDQRKAIKKMLDCEFIYLGYVGDDSIAGSPFERLGK